MNRALRRHRFVKVACTLIIVLLLTSWLVSVPTVGGQALCLMYEGPEGSFRFERGKLYLSRFPHQYTTNIARRGYAHVDTIKYDEIDWSCYGFQWPRKSSTRLVQTTLLIPIWIPLLVVGFPTILLWLRGGCPTPGFCPTCGYDLKYNASGRCPECGTAIHTDSMICKRPS